jgi:hypothetical protein
MTLKFVIINKHCVKYNNSQSKKTKAGAKNEHLHLKQENCSRAAKGVD